MTSSQHPAKRSAWDTGESVARHPSESGYVDWITQDAKGRGSRGRGEVADYAKTDRTAVELRDLGTSVDTRRDLDKLPQPLPPRAKEHLMVRTRNEIFGSTETQKWYIEAIRAAFKGMDGDKLHDFIMKHKSYESRQAYVDWNREFAEIFGDLKIPEKHKGQNDAITHRRITAATQHLLVENWNTNVFQLDRQKPNPWIFIDGRMGPYTVSVLSSYWNQKYSKKSQKTPNPLGDAKVDGEFPEGSRESDLFDEALDYRDAQIGKEKSSSDKPDDKTPPETPPALPENLDAATKKYYEKLDTANPNEVTWDKLRIMEYKTAKALPVAEALIEAYKETATQAPKTSHILHLLALQKGRDVNTMKIAVGEILNIENGSWKITQPDGSTEVINLNGKPIEDRSNPPKTEPPKTEDKKEEPPKTEPPKKAEETEADKEAKRRYARLDKAGTDLDNKKLAIQYECIQDSNLSEALALAYNENPQNAKESPKTFRALNLIAQKIGATINDLQIKQGDIIEITEDGNFNWTRGDKTRTLKLF